MRPVTTSSTCATAGHPPPGLRDEIAICSYQSSMSIFADAQALQYELYSGMLIMLTCVYDSSMPRTPFPPQVTPHSQPNMCTLIQHLRAYHVVASIHPYILYLCVRLLDASHVLPRTRVEGLTVEPHGRPHPAATSTKPSPDPPVRFAETPLQEPFRGASAKVTEGLTLPVYTACSSLLGRSGGSRPY